jgi:hypothetical protein
MDDVLCLFFTHLEIETGAAISEILELKDTMR